jgi:alpha-amylase
VFQGTQWWTRYQPVSYDLVSRSGSLEEFVNMVQRCKRVGVGIIVDAVTNHMAAGSGTGVNGTVFSERSFPLYSREDFHFQGNLDSNCMVNNYQDQHNVQYCDLVGLPDLCTGCEKVQQTVSQYLSMLHALDVTGVRMDAAKHMNPSELAALLVRSPGMYVFQEVIGAAGEAVMPSWYVGLGDVTEFAYAESLASNMLMDGGLQYLAGIGEAWGLLPREHAVVFVDNHDTQRGGALLTYKSGALYTLASIFMLAHPYGYPKVREYPKYHLSPIHEYRTSPW